MDEFKHKKILIIGELWLMNIVGTVNRISPEAPVLFQCTKREHRMGGAANVSIY